MPRCWPLPRQLQGCAVHLLSLLLAQEFERAYKREFGFTLEKRAIIVDDLRVRSTGRVRCCLCVLAAAAAAEAEAAGAGGVLRAWRLLQGTPLPSAGKLTADPGPLPEAAAVGSAYFEVCLPAACPRCWHGPQVQHAQVAAVQDGGRQDTPAYRISQLKAGHELLGPAILLDEISTIVVEPRCRAHVTAAGDVRIDVLQGAADKDLDPDTCDPVQLGIFSHRSGLLCMSVGL